MELRETPTKQAQGINSPKEYEPPITHVTGGFESLDVEPRPLVPLHLECLLSVASLSNA